MPWKSMALKCLYSTARLIQPVMTAERRPDMAQGMDAATLHIWDYDAVKPAVQEELGKGIILTSFFSPLGETWYSDGPQ